MILKLSPYAGSNALPANVAVVLANGGAYLTGGSGKAMAHTSSLIRLTPFSKHCHAKSLWRGYVLPSGGDGDGDDDSRVAKHDKMSENSRERKVLFHFWKVVSMPGISKVAVVAEAIL